LGELTRHFDGDDQPGLEPVTVIDRLTSRIYTVLKISGVVSEI
jgi:hypothetical protein